MMWAILIAIVIATVLQGICVFVGVMKVYTAINDLDRHLADRFMDLHALEGRWPM